MAARVGQGRQGKAGRHDVAVWVGSQNKLTPKTPIPKNSRVREAGAGDHLSGHVALPQVVRPHGGERVDRILIGDNRGLRWRRTRTK